MLPTARLKSSPARFCIRKAPACLTSTRNSVCSPCLADTVIGQDHLAHFAIDRLHAGIQVERDLRDSIRRCERGPCGDSKEQSFRYTACSASCGSGAAAGAVSLDIMESPSVILDCEPGIVASGCCSSARAQQGVEFPGGIQRVQVVAAADMPLADENLRHGAPAAAARSSPRAGPGRASTSISSNGDALGGEQRARPRAVGAPGSPGRSGPELRGHGSAVGSLARERQVLGTPGAHAAAQVEDLGEALAASLRTVAAAVGPRSQ